MSALRRERGAGFTLIELTIVIVVIGIVLTFAGLVFSGYLQRSSARRAAQLFAQDLTMARSYAIRTREPVMIRFYEATRWYHVEASAGSTEVVRRRFGDGADVSLSSVTLDVAGDSIVFDARGFSHFTGGSGGLGSATFSSGAATYTVWFNGMGASKVDRT